jgi:hypothetical protein
MYLFILVTHVAQRLEQRKYLMILSSQVQTPLLDVGTDPSDETVHV